MKAIQWVERVKAARGLESDYAAAKAIGISRFTVSGYRKRPDATLDEEVAYKVAQSLGVDPAGIIVDQVAERSKSPEISAALHRVANQLCILC